jgi:hypothetical protein
LQSCWKDESLKDKDFDDIHINISPSFGIPLADLTLTGGDIVKQFDLSDSSSQFYVEYEADGLCVIVYDKTNSRISLPPVLPFDTTVSFPINYFSGLRIDGVTVEEARVNLNIDNGYTKDIHFHVDKLEYEDENGIIKQVTTGNLNNTNVIKAATSNGQFTRTQLFKDFLKIRDPLDIVKNGKYLYLGFDLDYELLENSASINLNPVVKVPAWFTIENFSRKDTVSADLTNLSDIFNDTTISLKEATLYLTINNGLPMETDLQVYFADENYRLIDSLQSKELQIPSGVISSYKLVQPTSASFEINISEQRFKKIEKSKYIIFKESFRTNNGRDVKLFRSNTLGITLSAKAKAEVNGTISDITK